MGCDLKRELQQEEIFIMERDVERLCLLSEIVKQLHVVAITAYHVPTHEHRYRHHGGQRCCILNVSSRAWSQPASMST